ncbi:RHS repeat-associated core domain-containing protein [Vandammella animalimorsus]|nr:RHS repeat-associated core domain-containing protein [Vandammella animalimorsus]
MPWLLTLLLALSPLLPLPAQAQPHLSGAATPWVAEVELGVGLQLSASAPSVRQPNGEYRETHIDLRVNALGGPIDIARSWSQGRWWLNPAWAPLNFELDPLDGSARVIERAGLIYERSGSSELFISKANSYAPVFIRKTTSNPYSGQAPGWQWSDRLGNTIDYDRQGRILGYANPSGVQVRFVYDSASSIRILDHLDQLAYRLSLQDGLVTQVQDRAGRSVHYHWSGAGEQRRLSQVTDVAGHTWQYRYDSHGQLTQRIDPLGEQQGDTITVRYASSVAAPPAQLTVGSAGQTYDPSGASGPRHKLRHIWGAARVAQLIDSRGTSSSSTEYLKEKRQYQVSQTDHRGNHIQITYDLAGFELARSFNGQATHRRQWDGNYHSIVTNARGLSTRYDYDHNRQITQIIHPDGSRESSQYNARGQKTRHVNELGIVSTWQYDQAGRLIEHIQAAGAPEQKVHRWQYDPYGQAIRYQLSPTGEPGDPQTITTAWQYDHWGNRISQTDALGQVTRYQYDAVGNLIARTDPLGRTSRYQYNSRSQLIAHTSALGHTRQYTYDARGQKTQSTDPLGHSQSTRYDRHGRIQSQTDALGHTTGYHYNEYGDLIQTTSAQGLSSTTEYDKEGRPTLQTDPQGNRISYHYGAKGTEQADLLIQIHYPGGLQTHYQYDQRGRKTVTTQKATSGPGAGQELRTSTTYDSAGQAVAHTSAAGKTTLTEYDSLGRVRANTDPDGHSTHYQYNLQDQATRVTDASGNVHQYQYDALKRLTQETRPEGGQTHYRYDAAGQLIERTDPDGNTSAWQYDLDGRTTHESKTHPSGQATLSQTTRYHYDAAGRLTGYEQHNGAGQRISQATYQLDALGRTSEETLSYGQGSNAISASLAQSWNADGQKTSQTYPDGSTAHYHYEQGLLKTASLPASQGSNPGNPGNPAPITWQSYAWNQPSAIQYPGVTRHNHYDGFWRYQRIHARRADSTNPANPANPTNPNTPSLLELSYQYDPDSNITHIQRQAGADIQGSTDYRYDRLDRLIQASPSLSLQELGLPHEHYSYDAVHNRTASAHQPGPWQYASGNRLTQWGQQQQATRYQYNHSGHITQKTQGGTNNPGNPGSPNASATSTTSYHYDAAQRLVHIEQNGQTIARYHYDPKGRRIAKTTGQGSEQTTTWYVYAEEGLIAELNEQGQTQKSYGWEPDSPWGTKILWQADHHSSSGTGSNTGTNPNAPTSSKTYHYIHSDHLGTPQIATDKNGQQTWAQVSEAFGKATISANASTEINIRFPGQYYDQETGTHYNFHRDYDPSTGRYLQSDPIGLNGGVNLFSYVEQSPLNNMDIYGLQSNGCGAAGSLFKPPDAPFGFDFLHCCNSHDECYGDCDGPSKRECDLQFCSCMADVCSMQNQLPKRMLCMDARDIYCVAVMAFGGDAFRNARGDCNCEK